TAIRQSFALQGSYSLSRRGVGGLRSYMSCDRDAGFPLLLASQVAALLQMAMGRTRASPLGRARKRDDELETSLARNGASTALRLAASFYAVRSTLRNSDLGHSALEVDDLLR